MRKIKMTHAFTRMVKGMVSAVLMTHLFACIWFFTARMNSFSDLTWVVRKGLINHEPFDQYLWALYWATQTITTVGYGDIPAKTNSEMILSFIWMLVGVGFYSFIIGNFSSFVQGRSRQQMDIQYRVKGLSELARKAQIPFETSKKIKKYIEANTMSFISQDEDAKLI